MKKLFWMLLIIGTMSYAQDSVDVIFRYTASSSTTIFLVGEFNSWNNAAWPMQFVGSEWTRKVRLPLGGNPTPPAVGVPGAWQYKFYYAGAGDWPNDPLNHHQNPKDNNNTYIITKDPTIFHFLPNQRQPIVTTNVPIISAYVYPKIGSSIDTGSIAITIDGTVHSNLGKYFDSTSSLFAWTVSTPLSNGTHNVIVFAKSMAGGSNADTVSFTVQAGFIQLTTQGGYSTYNAVKLLRGIVNDTSIHNTKIIRNNT
ncbi:MAG: hypothetical protein PHP42_12785, partial [Bacteroidota bacterium]|nr:hypothetical protein [Bacteroidota bacterium]